MNHNWVLGGSKLNEFIFQYADFGNNVAARTGKPQETFPNGVSIGYNTNTPQTTEQKKYQFRDDFSWHMTGMRRPRPRLQGRRQLHQRAAPVRHVLVGQDRLRLHPPDQRSGGPDQHHHPEQARRVGQPADQAVRAFFQDDWRVTTG